MIWKQNQNQVQTLSENEHHISIINLIVYKIYIYKEGEFSESENLSLQVGKWQENEILIPFLLDFILNYLQTDSVFSIYLCFS